LACTKTESKDLNYSYNYTKLGN